MCVLPRPLFGMLPNLNIFSLSVFFNLKGIVSKAIILCASKSKIEARSKFMCDHSICEGHCGKRQKTTLEDSLMEGFEILL